VAIEDQNDNIATTFTSIPITLSIASGAAGSYLIPWGTVTVRTVNGVATFAGLDVNNPGSDTLRATAPYSGTAFSNSFAVVPVPVRQNSLFNEISLSSTSLVFQQVRIAQAYALPPSNSEALAVLAGNEQLAAMLVQAPIGPVASPAFVAASDPPSTPAAAGNSASGSNADSQVLDSGSGDNNLLD
jgi:hypothetical protein